MDGLASQQILLQTSRMETEKKKTDESKGHTKNAPMRPSTERLKERDKKALYRKNAHDSNGGHI